ncbi:MAG: glycosyltransferase family 39 protein [Candidatus Omnitrophica bacterium]|nr:glycosyltransferase family 39 protein [Candidatus Omnitrophota bacterium]
MNLKKIKYISLGLFACLVIFHIANNLFFLARNPLPEGKDSYAHITAFSNFKQIIENIQNNPFFRSEKSLVYNLVFVVIDYPPLFYMSAYLINLLLGSFLLNAVLLTNTFYMIILLLSVYFIANRINPIAAIISAFVCSMYPIVFIASRHFSLELAIASIAALSVLLLIKTDCFLDRKNSFYLGVCLGLGMLIKQTFIIYVGGPLIFYVWTSLIAEQPVSAKNKKKVNITLCLLIGVLISLIFYYNKAVYFNILNRAGFIGAVNSANLFSLEHITYYFRILPQTIGYFFLLVLVGCLFYLRNIKAEIRTVLGLWLLVPLVFFTFVKLKYGEYTIAYLPALSLISGIVISQISKKTIRVLVIASMILIGGLNYYLLSFNIVSNFYSTYYLPVPDVELAYSETTIKTPDKLLEDIAFSNSKIGIFYDTDPNTLIFPSYFIRSVGINPKKNAQIVEFYFSPDIFFHVLDDFDIMFFITHSEESWITEQSFNQLICEINDKQMNLLQIKQADIIRLINFVGKFAKPDMIIFDKPNKQEKIYIYKRNK